MTSHTAHMLLDIDIIVILCVFPNITMIDLLPFRHHLSVKVLVFADVDVSQEHVKVNSLNLTSQSI